MKNEKHRGNFIYWTPRILSILFACFLALFSLDIFDSEVGFKDIAIGLLMHNIPTIVLLFITLVAWKYELVGTVAFALAGLAYAVLVFSGADELWYTRILWVVNISGPAFLIAGLYYIGWRRKKDKGDAEIK